MSFDEYEDRFRRLAPSWRQILMVTHNPTRTRRRTRRWLVAAGLIVVTMLTVEVSSHGAAHGHVGSESAAPAGFDVLPGGFRVSSGLSEMSETGRGPSH